MIVGDWTNGSTVTNLTVFGNSNAYKLELANPNPCHYYFVGMELNYLEKCTSGISIYFFTPFEASESKLLSVKFDPHAVPFQVDKETVAISYRPDDPAINVSFKV